MTAQQVEPGACVAAWCGVICTDLDRSLSWYADTLGCKPEDEGHGWASLAFSDGSVFELYGGDRARPGLIFPSYGSEPGPPLMPGYAVDDPDEVTLGLLVARRLPGWVVVIAPDRLRIVLTNRDTEVTTGLVGFRFRSPYPVEQRSFLASLGVEVAVDEGEVEVIPVVAGDRDAEVLDPDGARIAMITL